MKKPVKPKLPIKPQLYNYDEKSIRKEIKHFSDGCDLQSIIDCCPKNINYNDLRIEAFDNEDSYCEITLVIVFYEQNKAMLSQYKEDLKQYKKNMNEYDVKLAEYNRNLLLFDKQRLERKLKNVMNILSQK
jgi:hypothetical protein